MFAASVPFAASAPVAQASRSAHARLVSVAKKHPRRNVVAIAQFDPGVSERRARALVRSHGGRVTERLPGINGFAIRLPARQARGLLRSRRIVNVTLNARIRANGVDGGSLATNYPKTVGADKLWAAGITGRGVGVAVIDSGISGDMPDFANADGSSRIAANVLAVPGTTRPGDDIGHGTHVAGIIAGNSFNRPAADPARGAYVGIAPEADLVAIKVADDDGYSTVLDVIGALEFAVEHKDALNIRVINLSVSSDTPASYLNDPLDAAVEFAWHAGMRIGGTSAAAPVVSGAAALLLQARPELNPDEVKALLTAHTNPTAARPSAPAGRPVPVVPAGPPPVGLGTANRFAVLAGSTVTNTGPSTINGDLGLSPGTAVTGFPPGTVQGTTQAANPVALEAKSDLAKAYDDAVGRTPPTPAPADLGGLKLTPGVYRSGSSLALTGDLELDAQGDPNAVFVFQAGSTLISASASRVKLAGGAQASNVFWQVGSSATLGTTTDFAGNILALTSITMNDGVTLNGRALARNGAVTLINDTITAPHCAKASAAAAAATATAGGLRELDVSRALPADPGAGANQGLTPNLLVKQVLVDAGVDPTRATWTRAQWTRAQWTRAQWTRAQWTRAQWTRAQWTRAQWTRACASCP